MRTLSHSVHSCRHTWKPSDPITAISTAVNDFGMSGVTAARIMHTKPRPETLNPSALVVSLLALAEATCRTSSSLGVQTKYLQENTLNTCQNPKLYVLQTGRAHATCMSPMASSGSSSHEERRDGGEGGWEGGPPNPRLFWVRGLQLPELADAVVHQVDQGVSSLACRSPGVLVGLLWFVVCFLLS